MQTLDLSKAVQDILNEYGDDVAEGIQKALTSVGKEGVSVLKAKSNGHIRTGRYAKGWRADKVQLGYGMYEIVLHNKTDWNLTHLLNNGYYSVRAKKRIPGDGHIDSAETDINNEFIKTMEEELS